MKNPEEYLDNQLRGPERPAMVTYAEALAGIKAALADAERYKNNLVGALRRVASPATQTLLDVMAPDSGTVELGGRTLPWRATASATPILPTNGEEPPF